MLYDQMKQKRKVKSLLPKKFCLDGRMLTILLLVLSLVLCLWSVSLLTHSVKAAENGAMQIQSIPYTWIDNKVEVLYNMQFVDPSDLEKVVNNLYMSGESLYISPNIVVISGNNIVWTGIYSHILWWIWNEIYSDNVTIIAWKNNIVKSGNDNASILWWMDNVFYSWKEGWASIVSIWWQLNKVEMIHDGVALIWWSGNAITGGGEISNAFILWGEKNKIEEWGIDNIIIWWKGVVDVGHENIFIYSNNDGFFPAKSNVFYLSVVSGAGINTDWIEWLSVGWAVSIGWTPPNRCTPARLWEVMNYSGCLIWCTNVWVSTYKWQMLDQSSKCTEVCERFPGHRCFKDSTDEIDVNYTAQCTKWVNTGNAHLCVSWELSKYKNVLFETNLIDSEEKCNFTQDICVYQCNQWTHLTWAGANRRCYSDCSYTRNNWTEVRDIRHWDYIIWYDTGSVKCGDNGVTDTCTNHLTGLYCNDGHMKIGWMDGEDVDLRVYYDSCLMSRFKCDTWTYDLSYHDIETRYLDSFSTGGLVWWQIVTWHRWVYKVCINYGWLGTDICTTWSQNFAFLWCKPWYTTGDADWVCRNGCDWLPNGTKRTRYKSGSVTCTGACEWKEFTCYDGTWTWGDKSQYPYTWCSLNDKICNTGVYNVTYEEYLNWLSTSIYECCTGYIASGNTQCNIGDVACKLVGCEDWYVTGENYDKFCIDDDIACEAPVPYWDWVVKWPGTFKYWDLPDLTPWTHLTWDAPSELWACQWRCRSESWWIWDGNLWCTKETPVCTWYVPDGLGVLKWNGNPPQSTGWKYTNGLYLWPCDWTCDSSKNFIVNSAQTGCICKDNYEMLGDRCVESQYFCTWGDEPGENTTKWDGNPTNWNEPREYNPDCNNLWHCEWCCQNGYKSGHDCVPYSNAACWSTHFNCAEWTSSNQATWVKSWTWNCDEMECKECRSGYQLDPNGFCKPIPTPSGECCDEQPSHSSLNINGDWCYYEATSWDVWTCKTSSNPNSLCISERWVHCNSISTAEECETAGFDSSCCTREPDNSQQGNIAISFKCDTWYVYSNCECIRPNSNYCDSVCKPQNGENVYDYNGTCFKSCFIAWTKVIMADWSQKNIEDIKIWEKVLWSNWTVNTVLWYDRPILWNRHLWSINGSEYFVSDEHPFMTTEWWKSFNPEMTKLEVNLNTTELKVWDILVTKNGLEKINSINYMDGNYNTPLYNLVLDGDHTYYANNYLVHNKAHVYAVTTTSDCESPYHWVPNISNPPSVGCCLDGFDALAWGVCLKQC